MSRDAAHPAAELPRTRHAREDEPVVVAEVDGRVADGLYGDERDVDRIVPLRPQRLEELTLAAGRPGDDDSCHGQSPRRGVGRPPDARGGTAYREAPARERQAGFAGADLPGVPIVEIGAPLLPIPSPHPPTGRRTVVAKV